jgi:hypothetical protein
MKIRVRDHNQEQHIIRRLDEGHMPRCYARGIEDR